MIYKTSYNSPVGTLILTAKNDFLTGLYFAEQKKIPVNLNGEITENGGCRILNQTKNWLDRYFSGANPEITELKLAPEGSGFAKTVWKLLCEIPYGKTTTYGALAKKIAAQRGCKKMSAQAVGGAVGRNPVSVIIPCHRVIGSNGSITGYAAGIEKKIKLLEIEAHFTSE